MRTVTGGYRPKLSSVFFNMYERTGDEAFLRRSHDAWQYIRTHLLDGGNGEWFWSVRADGSVNRDDDKAGF